MRSTKNVFIVTSALKPAIGAFSDDDRFTQTIASLQSIRNKMPEAVIVFCDVSIRPVSEKEKATISQYSNFYLDFSEHPLLRKLSQDGAKSQAENILLYFTFMQFMEHVELKKLWTETKRFFKFSARSELEESFDINQYNDDELFGKYVFKKAIPTWMNNPQVSHLFITRMFSFCSSLVENYIEIVQANLNSINLTGIDTEHAHYLNIPKKYLVEFDQINCWGWLAGNGQIEHY